MVLLGTGNPGPSPERSGPGTAIIVNGQPYLVDMGPGVVRRAAAAQQKGIGALDPVNITHAFVTHLLYSAILHPRVDLSLPESAAQEAQTPDPR